MLLQTQVTVTDVDSRRTVTPAVTADGEEKWCSVQPSRMPSRPNLFTNNP
jgi:hypothetical protein